MVLKIQMRYTTSDKLSTSDRFPSAKTFADQFFHFVD